MKKKSSKSLHHLSLVFSPGVVKSCQDPSQHIRRPSARPHTHSTHTRVSASALKNKYILRSHPQEEQQHAKCTAIHKTCNTFRCTHTFTPSSPSFSTAERRVEQRIHHAFFTSPTLVIVRVGLQLLHLPKARPSTPGIYCCLI